MRGYLALALIASALVIAACAVPSPEVEAVARQEAGERWPIRAVVGVTVAQRPANQLTTTSGGPVIPVVIRFADGSRAELRVKCGVAGCRALD